MTKKFTPLRLVTLVSWPCVLAYCPSALADVQNIAANSISPISSVKAAIESTKVLEPTLVGVFVNGQEQGSIDALYESGSESKSDTQNNHYYLSIDDLNRLTMIKFLPVPTNTSNSVDTINNTSGYKVITPIGDAKLSINQVLYYQGQEYLSLSTLKKLGITADYNQSDLAISLNMGWRPSQNISSLKDNNAKEDLPIDYHPSRAGLLGLSFNSSLSASESNGGQNGESSTSRQMYADIGAYGYALGGVWGVNARGYDSTNEYKGSSADRFSNDGSFGKTALEGFIYLPSEWDDWEIDNLYWAKSGEHLATRLGINQPNSLGQGAQTSGSEFTGAMFAYSNRNISRHLSYFDEDSRSLLQNTSQDYQHLTGTGEAGGVAELRISGRPIARVQIGLDGRYEFLNLDVSQLTLTDTLVEVAIYAYPLARQPLEVRPILLGKRRTNAATNELIIEAGIGRTGNLINSDTIRRSNNNGNADTAAHLYTEYGVNNRLAVRGGVNTNIQNLQEDNDSLSWHAGANYSLSTYSNADISYANTPTQDLWQAQLEYQRKKMWVNYQYQARQYDSTKLNTSSQNESEKDRLNDQRHQLLLNYSPSDRTNISINQYYEDMAIKTADADDYYAYTSINHRFNDALNVGANWNTRDNRYGYRLTWQDAYRIRANNNTAHSAGTRNTIGLSGDNDSDTLSLRHQLDNRTNLGQSISRLHRNNNMLYQGDISYRFDTSSILGRMGGDSTDSSINAGYSLYGNQIGWLVDWQINTRKGINFGLGYKHRYVDAVPSSLYTDLINDSSFIDERELPAWTQNNYLYASLSFDMFKAPKQRLQVGNYPRQRDGSVIVDIEHQADTPIDYENMRFELDNQKVIASLLGSQATHSQYLISNIKAGDYTLTMDSENLPLEYSTGELQKPRIRVSNYAPTSVPIQLKKTYGVSGKLADAKEGVVVNIYKDNEMIQSANTGSYGYFQIFGLSPNTYTLKVKGYKDQSVDVTNNFVMRILLQPSTL
ncbi:hypothetical protein CAN34_12900 [Psychrobacter sp. DAB_AL32B]|nr:hypothetical protein CAN34_12900 [Psychrobacter sp. DAB_AL32B]